MTCRGGCISLGVTALASWLLKGFDFTLPVTLAPALARGFGPTLLSQHVPSVSEPPPARGEPLHTPGRGRRGGGCRRHLPGSGTGTAEEAALPLSGTRGHSAQ